jgi:hypothetical protein
MISYDSILPFHHFISVEFFQVVHSLTSAILLLLLIS